MNTFWKPWRRPSLTVRTLKIDWKKYGPLLRHAGEVASEALGFQVKVVRLDRRSAAGPCDALLVGRSPIPPVAWCPCIFFDPDCVPIGDLKSAAYSAVRQAAEEALVACLPC